MSFTTDDDRWVIAAFANNVTDKEYRIYNLDLGAVLGLSNQTYARPRWIGGSVTYNF